MNSLVACRVKDETGRQRVIEVLRATYDREKHWVTDPKVLFPSDDLTRNDISWFIVTLGARPAGALRVLYDPPLQEYAKYGFKLLDPALPVEQFVRDNRVAEIGRFAVVPEFRDQLMIAAGLMRVAAQETVSRGFSHFITDVFEDDPHSPYGFHTRLFGFDPVATHDVGELNCKSRRITLVLDLRAAYERLRKRGGWLYRYLTSQWSEALHRQIAA